MPIWLKNLTAVALMIGLFILRKLELINWPGWFKWYALVGVLFVLIGETLRFIADNYVSIDKSFRLFRLRMVMIYLGEIFLAFGIFRIVAENVHYDETSILKMFIDFFTVYQIGILVIYRMYDSISLIPYEKARHVFQQIRNDLSYNRIDHSIDLMNHFIINSSVPPSIRQAYLDTGYLLKNFRGIEDSKSAEAIEREQELLCYVDSFVLELDMRISSINAQFTASILLRQFNKQMRE